MLRRRQAGALSADERSYPASEVSAAAERSYPASEVVTAGRSYPASEVGAAARRRNPATKVRAAAGRSYLRSGGCAGTGGPRGAIPP